MFKKSVLIKNYMIKMNMKSIFSSALKLLVVIAIFFFLSFFIKETFAACPVKVWNSCNNNRQTCIDDNADNCEGLPAGDCSCRSNDNCNPGDTRNCNQAPTVPPTATPTPAGPTNLSKSCSSTTSEATFSWNLVDGVTNYILRIDKNDGMTPEWNPVNRLTDQWVCVNGTSATRPIVQGASYLEWSVQSSKGNTCKDANNVNIEYGKTIASSFVCAAATPVPTFAPAGTNQGFYRDVPIVNGTPNFNNPGTWSSAMNLATIPGSGDIQTQDEYVYLDNTKLRQSIWRGNQGFYRDVPIVNGVPNFNSPGAWSAPIGINLLPGSGDMQTTISYFYANNTKLRQSFWRGNQGYTRDVPVDNGIPNFNNAGAWSAPIAITVLPGNGDMQADDRYIYDNNTKLRQSVWRGGQGYWRDFPVENGTPNFNNPGAWSAPISLSILPGQGEILTLSGVFFGSNLRQSIWRTGRDVPPTATPLAPPNCRKALGDANCDGVIDGADYVSWLNRQCTTGCAAANLVADFNGDGRVDDTDYTVWFNNRLQ